MVIVNRFIVDNCQIYICKKTDLSGFLVT